MVSKYFLTVAIDFGTDGTAISYSSNSNDKNNDIYIIQDWNEKENFTTKNLGIKMKTNILLKKKNRITKINDNNLFEETEEVKDDIKEDNCSYEVIAFGNEGKCYVIILIKL